MKCPSLNDLPTPPTGKRGWPWTEESPALPATMDDGAPWLKISIITPSLNQGQFIEETIRSILLQGYPNLEYIIIDGGSNDGSIDIIKKYEPWLTYWVSEPDQGQAHAINKGFKKASGEIVAWLNSDDLYVMDTLHEVARLFILFINTGIIHGDGTIIDINNELIEQNISRQISNPQKLESYFPNPIFQPSVFFKRVLLQATGYLDDHLHCTMDLDLWVRLFRATKSFYYAKAMSLFRIHQHSKTSSNPLRFSLEKLIIINRYKGSFILFKEYLEQFICQNSMLKQTNCEETFNCVLDELGKTVISNEYLDCVRKNKAKIIANAYLLKCEYYYNFLDFINSRINLKRALHFSKTILADFKIWRLLFSMLLPKNFIIFLRRITRRSQYKHLGWHWIASLEEPDSGISDKTAL
jgi:glycosyltransferase involved in cell wall biosynthesis